MIQKFGLKSFGHQFVQGIKSVSEPKVKIWKLLKWFN